MTKPQTILLSFSSAIGANIVWSYPVFILLIGYLLCGLLAYEMTKRSIMRDDGLSLVVSWVMPWLVTMLFWEGFKEVLEENFGGAKKYFPTIRNPFVWGESNPNKE